MIVVDSSVIIKWFAKEDKSEQAKLLIRNECLAAPDLLIYEFTNYLANKSCLSSDEIHKFLNIFYNLKIEYFMLPQKGFQNILNLCRTYKITSYDASFIALAQTLETQLITADQKLLKKVNLPFVRAL